MSSKIENLSIGTSSPAQLDRDYTFPDTSDYQAEYYEVLASMMSEQSEHLYGKFNDSYLKYRGVVIAWMIDVCEYFHLHITTNHMAVAYLDRLQPNEKFTRFEWQILAISCIIIASKYNEMEEHVPGLKRIEEITQQEIPNDTFLYYELWTLKKMGWKLNARVPSAFLTAQMQLGLFSENDMIPCKKSFFPSSNKKMQITADVTNSMKQKMLDLSNKCIVDTKFRTVQSSAVATAIIYYVRRMHQVTPVWNDHLTALTFHDPKTSRSTLKALQLIIDMERAADKENACNQSNSEHCDFEQNSEESEEEDLAVDDVEPEEEEETDLVQALHRALFMSNETTPSKDSMTKENPNSMITPVLLNKNLSKGSLENDLSPIAVSDMISP